MPLVIESVHGGSIIITPPTTPHTNTYSVVSESSKITLNKDAVDVFVNEKYKNILIIINVSIKDSKGFTSLNDMTYFDNREGLYHNKTFKIIPYSPPTYSLGVYSYDVYNNFSLLSVNFLSTFNIQNQKTLFSDYITYHYIGPNNTSNWHDDYGVTKINIGDDNDSTYPLKETMSWYKNFTPYYIDCLTPTKLILKKNSYQINIIKGPNYLLNNDNISFNYEKYFISEPLSTFIILTKPQNKILERFRKNISYDDVIFRYGGNYEPIFKDVELFEPLIYSVIDGGFFHQEKCAMDINTYNQTVAVIEMRRELTNINEEKTYFQTKLDFIIDKKENAIKINDILELDFLKSEITRIGIIINNIDSEIKRINDLLNTKPSSKPKGLYVGGVVIPQNLFVWYLSEDGLGVCDGNFAFCELIISNSVDWFLSDVLHLQGFGFNIPLNAIIKGISFSVQRKSSSDNITTGYVRDKSIRLVKSSGIQGDDLSDVSNWSTISENKEYGGDNDLCGLNVTPEEVNNSNFGIKIQSQAKVDSPGNFPLTVTSSIDCVCMTIHYTIPGISQTITYTSYVERNTIFDTNLFTFGELDDLIYSKTNEQENPLIFATNGEKTIYPKIDEFGYFWNKRFIFKSSWDIDYYYKTKKE